MGWGGVGWDVRETYSSEGDDEGGIVRADSDVLVLCDYLLYTGHYRGNGLAPMKVDGMEGNVDNLRGSWVWPVTSLRGGIAVVLYGILMGSSQVDCEDGMIYYLGRQA